MRKYFTALLMLTMISCSPSYAGNGDVTTSDCEVVNKTSLEILGKYRNGKTQYQVFRELNGKSISYWNNSDAAKVITQTVVIDLFTAVRKGYNDTAIMKVVKASCENKLGKII